MPTGWVGSNRRNTLPPDWPQRRRRVLKRDGERCTWIRVDTGQRCNDHANQVDHVDQSRNWDHSDANLASLCEYHHSIKSSGEGGRANAAKRATNQPRRHPGLLQ